MIRNAEQEQLHRLTVKTLDQVFIAETSKQNPMPMHLAKYCAPGVGV